MINYNLKTIKALIFDVDGVLSKSTVSLGADGQPRRSVNIKDGYALQLAVKRGLLLAIITGAKVKEIELRYKNLGLKEIHIGCNVKLGVFRDLVSRYNLKPEEIAYMGDDIPDYEVMKEVGLPCCPSDAATEIKEISKYVSVCKGGEGCVRDLVEQVLKSQGAWMSDNTTFGW